MSEPFEPSSNTVRGLVACIEEKGLTAQVKALLSGVALEALTDPTARRWWPGTAYNQLGEAVVKIAGAQGYEDMSLDIAKKTFGPIVAPMVKVTLAIVGATPGGLLDKLALLASVAIRGPTFKWVSTGATSGTLTIDYLGPTSSVLALSSWRATIRYAFEMSKPGVIKRADAIHNKTFVFDVTW